MDLGASLDRSAYRGFIRTRKSPTDRDRIRNGKRNRDREYQFITIDIVVILQSALSKHAA
jgi:hypothetical protein